MPMIFTEPVVMERLKRLKLDFTGTEIEKRERLARYIEANYQDYVEAWEIRTGRPWDTMTSDEARSLIIKRPSLAQNPGVLSRLI